MYLERNCWSRIEKKQKCAQKKHQSQGNVLQVTRKGSLVGKYVQLVSAMRGGSDGKRLPMQLHVKCEDCANTRRMNIANIITKSPLLQKVDKVSRETNESKKSNTRRLAAAKSLT